MIGDLLRLLERIDIDKRFEWMTLGCSRGRDDLLAGRSHRIFFLRDDERVYRAFTALKRVLLLSPAAYFFFVVLMAREPRFLPYHPWLAAGVLALFTPFLGFIGESFYRWALDHGGSSRRKLPEASIQQNAAWGPR